MVKRILSIILAIYLSISAFWIFPVDSVFADEEILAQYKGATTASYGYKPNCTFTVNKIVNGKFTGRFAASNLGAYSFDES